MTIEGALGPGTGTLYDWVCRLADRPEPAPCAIAAPLLRHHWPARPDEIQARLYQSQEVQYEQHIKTPG